MAKPTAPIFFRTAAEFRAWLEQHHATARELCVGFHKAGSGQAGLTYLESVLEALCFGWIDGVIRPIDARTYARRFTPRRPGSIWSKVNVAHVERLIREQRLQPAGLAAYQARTAARTGVYAFEREQPAELPPKLARRFQAHRRAWRQFQQEPPWYRRLVIHKIVSAKRDATRERWLEKAIAAAADGRRIR